jgi:hypothetical protein
MVQLILAKADIGTKNNRPVQLNRDLWANTERGRSQTANFLQPVCFGQRSPDLLKTQVIDFKEEKSSIFLSRAEKTHKRVFSTPASATTNAGITTYLQS